MDDEPTLAEGADDTQLAESRPRINSQLRVLAASNTPHRLMGEEAEELLKNTLFSPTAMRNLATSTNFTKALPMSLVNVEQQAAVKNSLKDYSTMALSSNRAGKKDIEALAYASMGIIHDNLSNFKLAINSYQQYLSLSTEIGDVLGQRKALNFLGVDHYLQALALINKNGDAEKIKKHLQASISYHARHLDIADDGGRFVAYNNLGLCHDANSDLIEAAKHHQSALRLAIKMQSLHGQSVSVGNLGLLALKKSDFSTAKTCFEQHMQLTQTLQDSSAEVNAWKLVMLPSTCTSMPSSHRYYLVDCAIASSARRSVTR